MSWLLKLRDRPLADVFRKKCRQCKFGLAHGTLLAVLCLSVSCLADGSRAPKTEDDKQFNKLHAEIKAKVGGEQILKHYNSRFMGLSRNELRFMHDVCNFRRSQFDSVKADVDRTTRRLALDAARTQIAMNQGGARRAQQKAPNVYKVLEDGLMRAAREHLTENQATKYCDELEARRLFRKEADAQLLLGFMDSELRLTDDQRKKLLPHLVKAWAPSWAQTLSVMEGNGLRFMPKIPTQEFRTVLTEQQTAIFATFRQNGSIFFGMHVHQFPDVNPNEMLLVEELVFAPEVEEATP